MRKSLLYTPTSRPPPPFCGAASMTRAAPRPASDLVTGWHNARSLHHEHHRPFGSPRAVPYAARHDEALARRELDRAALEIDDEAPRDDVEELVFGVVLVPVVLPLHHTKPHDGVVDLAQRLVVPGMGARIDQRLDVDELERPVAHVEVSVVGMGRVVGHDDLLASLIYARRPLPALVRRRPCGRRCASMRRDPGARAVAGTRTG